MLFDLCYLAILCAIIIVTFVQVLLPVPALQTSADFFTAEMFPHFFLDALSPQITLLLCSLGLLYLKIIWRLIHPPRNF